MGFESENADSEARGWKLPVYGYELLTPSIEKRDVDIVKLLNFQFTIYQFFFFFLVWKCSTFSLARDTESLNSESGFQTMPRKKAKRKRIEKKNNFTNFQRQSDFYSVRKPNFHSC